MGKTRPLLIAFVCQLCRLIEGKVVREVIPLIAWGAWWDQMKKTWPAPALVRSVLQRSAALAPWLTAKFPTPSQHESLQEQTKKQWFL